jgi:hypothetical protein
MRFTRLLIGITGAWLTLVTSGCESGTTANDDFLPVITNFWRDVADQNHTLDMASNDDGNATGSITGTEEHPVFGTSAIAGTWVHSRVTFTITRPGGDVQFTGRFTAVDTLHVTGNGEDFIVATQ